MNTRINFKNSLVIFFQGVGATIAFFVGMMIANIVSPMPKSILDKTPEMGFLSLPLAILFSSVVDAVILVWAARRSSFKGLTLWGQLPVLSFGVQTFQTQIETGYFIRFSSHPL